MKLRKKIIFPLIVILICLAVGLLTFWHFHKQLVKDKGKIYFQRVTPEDRKPFLIPPEAVKNGRTVIVPILMYHHVGELLLKADNLQKDLTVPTLNFEAEIKWLSDNNYNSVSLKDIYFASLGKFTMPKKPVVFTFDDGYRDVFLNAVPILKKYGYTGSFGIITQWPGTSVGDNVYASWSDITAAYSAGNEIVSHTQTHFDGSSPKFTADYIYNELSGSVLDINKNLGFTTNLLIYPYGHYNETYIAQAKKAGLVMGVTVHEGKVINLDDLMHIPRIRVHGSETLDTFERMITE